MRKSIRIMALALSVFALSGGAAIAEEAPASGQAQRVEQNTTRVYYFHGNLRCKTCNKIEALTKKTLEESFAEQLKNGSMELQVINVDKAENEHFVDDYELAVRSVVLSQIKQGKEARWRRLDKVWQLVHDEPAFSDYLRTEIAALNQGTGS
ncbi:nitrophenyl compound nitroreductase subunit ArsF family protein [Candidatus Electronema sp. TJ]|uniref:nitrophenyl compound nitroreductase subunit ArsF family protein n=1 Tax=Candidatus Electronema sp. TJ TaxID=3401573 RepID=UPI003AA7D1A2